MTRQTRTDENVSAPERIDPREIVAIRKRLKLSQEAASQAGAATPLGAEATALYTMFVNAGNGGLDYSAIIKMIKGQ